MIGRRIQAIQLGSEHGSRYRRRLLLSGARTVPPFYWNRCRRMPTRQAALANASRTDVSRALTGDDQEERRVLHRADLVRLAGFERNEHPCGELRSAFLPPELDRTLFNANENPSGGGVLGPGDALRHSNDHHTHFVGFQQHARDAAATAVLTPRVQIRSRDPAATQWDGPRVKTRVSSCGLHRRMRCWPLVCRQGALPSRSVRARRVWSQPVE